MIKEDQPNLTLETPAAVQRSPRRSAHTVWLRLILVLQIAAIICLVMILLRPGARKLRTDQLDKAQVEQLKQLAVDLEDRSLDVQAADAWTRYLDAAPEADDRAEIHYRVGKLHMRAGQFGEAAAALVQAEQEAEDDEGLKKKIGPNMVECLSRLGLYGEVGRELSRRAAAGGDKGGPKVLATLGGELISEADLDRMIEQQVDEALALDRDPNDAARREAMLQRLSSPQMRRQLLNELVQIEMFCRRARELRIDRDEDYVAARDSMIRNLLASKFLGREFAKIEAADVDLEAYFNTNIERYKEPDAVEVRLVKLEEDEDAAKLLEEVESAEDFIKLVDERDESDESDQSPDKPRRLVRGTDDPILGSTEKLFELEESRWTTEPHEHGDARFLVLVEKKIPGRTPELAEIKDRVRSEYLMRKQTEHSQKLVQTLMSRYDVHIMPPSSKPATKPEEEKTP